MLITTIGWVGIFLGYAIKALDKCFELRRDGPKVKRACKHQQIGRKNFGNQLVKPIFLDAGFAVAACITSQTTMYLILTKRNNLNDMTGLARTCRKAVDKLSRVTARSSAASNYQDVFLYSALPAHCFSPYSASRLSPCGAVSKALLCILYRDV